MRLDRKLPRRPRVFHRKSNKSGNHRDVPRGQQGTQAAAQARLLCPPRNKIRGQVSHTLRPGMAGNLRSYLDTGLFDDKGWCPHL